MWSSDFGQTWMRKKRRACRLKRKQKSLRRREPCSTWKGAALCGLRLNVATIRTYVHDLDDKENGTDTMVFEFCNAGDIRRMIEGCKDGSGKLIHLTEFEILHIGVQLASGLSVLHEHKIVHRDLALRNLFVHCDAKGDLTVKIGDFGLCVDVGDRKLPTDKRKNVLREAPEIDDVNEYDEKSDVYALGLVLYELLSLVDLSHGTLYDLTQPLWPKSDFVLLAALTVCCRLIVLVS